MTLSLDLIDSKSYGDARPYEPAISVRRGTGTDSGVELAVVAQQLKDANVPEERAGGFRTFAALSVDFVERRRLAAERLRKVKAGRPLIERAVA